MGRDVPEPYNHWLKPPNQKTEKGFSILAFTDVEKAFLFSDLTALSQLKLQIRQ